jgi:hypothetical protein
VEQFSHGDLQLNSTCNFPEGVWRGVKYPSNHVQYWTWLRSKPSTWQLGLGFYFPLSTRVPDPFASSQYTYCWVPVYYHYYDISSIEVYTLFHTCAFVEIYYQVPLQWYCYYHICSHTRVPDSFASSQYTYCWVPVYVLSLLWHILYSSILVLLLKYITRFHYNGIVPTTYAHTTGFLILVLLRMKISYYSSINTTRVHCSSQAS